MLFPILAYDTQTLQPTQIIIKQNTNINRKPHIIKKTKLNAKEQKLPPLKHQASLPPAPALTPFSLYLVRPEQE